MRVSDTSSARQKGPETEAAAVSAVNMLWHQDCLALSVPLSIVPTGSGSHGMEVGLHMQ